MKKILVLLLVSILLITSLPALAEDAAQSQAWDEIFALLEKETGYAQNQMTKGQLVYERGVWGFSVIITDHPADEDGLLVGQMDNQGQLTILQESEKISLDAQLQADLKACFNREDCYLLLAAVHDKWLPILQSLSEDQLSKIFQRYVAIIRLNISTPSDGTITYGDAYNAALQHLAQQPGWSEEQAHMFRLSISAYYTPEDIARPVYFFNFEQHSYFEEAYESDADMNRYKAALKKAFGGEAPRHFSIMVDAMDGSLVEAPIYDYAPIQYHYLDFLIRPEEMINAQEGVS